MKVIVDDNVVKAIDDFYIAAMSRHISKNTSRSHTCDNRQTAFILRNIVR